MKKNVITFSVLALIVLIATLTNPDQDRHKEVLKNKLNAYMQQSMKDLANSTDEWEQAGNAFIGIGALGNVFMTKELDRALNEGLLNN
jgi:hypothetical protein